jgi:DNA uptake protein ComE-like DNA-binding protein
MRKTLLSLIAVLCCVRVAAVPAAARDAPPENPPATAATAPAPKVDLNSATVEALGKLNGISPARARAIVENRCYETAADLVDRRILPKSAFQKIEDQVETSAACVRDEPAAAGAPKTSGR